MRSGSRWFWPLIAAGVALASIASVLTALAIENPAPAAKLPALLPGVSGACLGLLSLFARESGDPLDTSDVPLLLIAGAAALGAVASFWAARSRR
jgi:hypothetical protein